MTLLLLASFLIVCNKEGSYSSVRDSSPDCALNAASNHVIIYSIGRGFSRAIHQWNSHEILHFQYCNYVIDCSVQCVFGTRNSKTTVQCSTYCLIDPITMVTGVYLMILVLVDTPAVTQSTFVPWSIIQPLSTCDTCIHAPWFVVVCSVCTRDPYISQKLQLHKHVQTPQRRAKLIDHHPIGRICDS